MSLRLNVSRFSCRAGRPIDNNHRAHSSVTDGITQVAGALIKAEFPAKYSNWRVHALPGNLICFPFDGGPQIDPDDIAIRVLSSRAASDQREDARQSEVCALARPLHI